MSDRIAPPDGRAALLPQHYIGKLAIEIAMADGIVIGSAPVRPELFAPGTHVVRSGLLATMVDLVAGHAPVGPVGPTIDLRLQRIAPPPVEGRIRLECRPLRVGRRLIVAETRLAPASTHEHPFALALTTFMNERVGDGVAPGARPLPPMDEDSFDDFLAPRVERDGTMVLDAAERYANGIQGTVQGGAQTLFAELAAEHAIGEGRWTATDVDVRFLGRMRVGPLAARVEHVARTEADERVVRVRLTDAGDGDKVVSHVSLSMHRAG